MVRGKVQMKKIEDATSRQVTFSKRRTGLVKKANELSVLCDAQVAVIVFSQNGRLYEFSSSDMTKILERYHECTKGVPANKFGEDYIQQLKFDCASMAKNIELLELSKRQLLEQNVSSCSYNELKGIEEQLQISLQRIRQRKDQLYKEQIEQLQSQESSLVKENAKLSAMWQREKKTSQKQQWGAEAEAASSHAFEVDTELFIGLPKQHC
ncbi:MADS-box protein AGL42 isoform X1 [Cajanus cajan]|uniref:MADS-box protein AGL42 isoform X1 n=1 Tax=Cajanus cajan TaxID=3821 RepID=UPI0010FBA3F9|nr:MADS-box protein AGL42 isoform X1 [Cajanus cajan]